MADEKKAEFKLELLIGPAVGVLVFALTFTELYERAELVTYDWRFNVRNSLFGPPPMHPDLGTIDIDLPSVEAEGRYQDWTRDKYTDVVRILDEYGGRMVGFDVFFIEPSTKLVDEHGLLALPEIDRESVEELLAGADHDELFRQTIEEAGNVYLAQTIVVPHEDLDVALISSKMEVRTSDEERALNVIRERAPKLMVDADESTLWRGFDFDPPLRTLREAARGFAYAQTVTDVDGARRRYPLVYQYEDIVFPSMALAMVCDYLDVPIERVEVWPGEYTLIPQAQMSDGTVEDVKIPIDNFGNVNVNWVGTWDESFVHYPHIALRRTAERDTRQKLLDTVKALAASDPALKNPRALAGALARAGYDDRNSIRGGVGTWAQAMGIEAAVRTNGDMTAETFWQSKGLANPGEVQITLFNQVKRTNLVADLIIANTDIDLDGLERALPGEDRDRLRQSEYFVHSILEAGEIPPSSRPLYFYPYRTYLDRMLTPDDIAGKVLFYGLTAPGTTDLSVTPVQGSYPMVGIYPNVLNTILEGIFIRRLPAWIDGLVILAIGIALSLSVPRLKVLGGAALSAAALLIYALCAFLAFTHFGLWIEFVGPLMALIVGFLAITIYGYVIKEKEKDFVQGAFGHYLAPAVVEQIMNNPDMINQLGGEERVMTSFFSDVASFSTISECLTPAELVNFINDYLSEMCEIIEEFGGTIDKFEGDAILAFFGAPAYMDDHAVRGCLSCVDQQRAMVEARNRWKTDQSLPPALYELWDRWDAQERIFAHVRMGLTAGPMVVGNMGSRARTDYTMMGDTVNLAARFESGQKLYGTGIMVNEAIHKAVADIVEWRQLDVIQVVGKEEPVKAFEVLERKGELDSQKYQVLELYDRGLEAYQKFEFVEAQRIFQQALEVDPADGPSALYADRCEDFASNPPEDLIFRAESK